MRRYKKLNIDFGVQINHPQGRELIAEEFTRPKQMTIGPRPEPFIDGNITFQKDPRFPWTNKFLAQVNFRSSDEWKVMRMVTKYGAHIVQLREDLQQRGHEETDNTNTGKLHSFECVDEMISHGSFG